MFIHRQNKFEYIFRNIKASENNIVSFFTSGEGHHNYHHCFPYDYKTSESFNYGLNFSTAFIDFFAWLGWATELKTVPDCMIKRRMMKTGDLREEFCSDLEENKEKYENINNFWGLPDDQIKRDHRKHVKIM